MKVVIWQFKGDLPIHQIKITCQFSPYIINVICKHANAHTTQIQHVYITKLCNFTLSTHTNKIYQVDMNAHTSHNLLTLYTSPYVPLPTCLIS